MRILALDPSGTSTTGIFLYENWSKWEISSFTSENWLEQVKNLRELVKKEQVDILACEVSSLWEKQNHTYHFDNLIKLVGVIEYLAQEGGIEYVPVSNQYMSKWEAEAKEGKIAGLVCREVQGKTGRPKQAWFFKGRGLNDHEKDAVLIFWVYWCKFSKREWPFAE